MNYDGADLAVIIPLWRRTANIERVHDSVRATVPKAKVVFVYSAGDQPVIDALLASPDRYERETLCINGIGGERGDYARKINAGYRATTEPVLFTGADDVVFHDGWYDVARPLLDVPEIVETIIEPGALGGTRGVLIGPKTIPRIGVVGTNDLANPRTMRGEHSTHSLVARWYADQGGSPDEGHMIYHEGYWHEFCDDELVQTAMAREAYAHALGAHVEHHHPIVKQVPNAVEDDDVYRRGRAFTRDSRRLFARRRSLLWGRVR